MITERTQSIRTISSRLNSFHSAIYFSDIVGAEYAKCGFEPGLQANMAGRSAPLGRVNAGVVTAAFYNYSPRMVGEFIPSAWDIASPEDMVAARFAGVAAFEQATYGDREDIALLTEAATHLAEALAPVVAAMDFGGRTLAGPTAEVMAAHEPTTAFEALWDVATVYREFRGDGHVASLVAAGVPGIDALLLDVATGAGFKPRAAQKTRGYTDEEWAAAQTGLADAGLITIGTDERGYDLPQITEEGVALKAEIELVTDGTVEAAWSGVDDETIAALAVPSRALIKVLAQSGAFPASVFAQPNRKAS